MLPDYALIEAIKRGSESELEQALERGADLNARDLDGTPAILVATHCNHNDIAELLIRKGADIRKPVDAKGNTLLHKACTTGNYGFAALLLQNGVESKVVNLQEICPLHLAVKNGHEYLCRLLLTNQALTTVMDRKGDTPLHVAARRREVSLIKLLVSAGSPLDCRNARGFTPLHEAARAGHTDAARLLISSGSQLDSSMGVSARKVAERYGHLETAAAIAAGEAAANPYTSRVLAPIQPRGHRSR